MTRRGRQALHRGHLKHIRENRSAPRLGDQAVAQMFAQYLTQRLDGVNRLSLINPVGGGDVISAPTTALGSLFVNDEKRAEVRRIVNEATGLYFVIDPSTTLGSLRIRLSRQAPQDALQERALDERAMTFHAQAQPIEGFSDGVKAFVGTVTDVVAGNPLVLLIDEPEAFLHPGLASKLGLEICKAIRGTHKRIFASTLKRPGFRGGQLV